MITALRRYCYLTIYGIVKYLPTPFGDVFRFLVLKSFGCRIQTIWVHEGVTIHWPEKVKIGIGTALNEFVFINGFGEVSIGKKVAIGNGAKIFSAEHVYEERELPVLDQPIEARKIEIGDGVYIGMNAVVLGGCRIGKNAVIGAGAVVTKDVPDYAVVMGNPGRVVFFR